MANDMPDIEPVPSVETSLPGKRREAPSSRQKDPAIHHFQKRFKRRSMDTRVKPAYDAWRGGEADMTPLEKVNAMKMPFAELKGVTFTEADKDRVVARMLVRPDLCTLNHTIHGGAIMAFADSVGAAATVINLPEDAKGTTTIESKTNFIGGAKEGMTVIATATPVHRGRRTQVWQTRLTTEEGKLVAIVTQTQMVL
jgi:1,4-dihydroxy-2-naphthoyl-CoA hydrolase